MNFNLSSSEVVGFDSTWDKDKDKQLLVRDSGTDVMENNLELSNKLSFTQETSDISVS